MPSTLEQHTISINSANFNYYRTPGTKDSGKPVLVLQHGFSDNGLCWEPVAQELAADYDIIMPDARGHGLSARVARGEKVDQAADLAALIRALSPNQVLVAGHSMGAHIASDLAARFPEMVRAAVLEDPPWFLPPPGAPQPRGSMEESPLGQWMIGLKDKSLEQIMAESRQEHPTWPDSYLRPWCQGKLDLDLNFLAADTGMGRGWQERVPKIKCPVLLITAEPGLGGIVTPEIAQLAEELNPKFQVVNFPGVGHHVRFAVHDAYIQVIKAFLSQAE
jgi:pimeloyl-ACP methyl ester carboxylesterase